MGPKAHIRRLDTIVGDKYKVEKLIGEGGFCIVMKAKDIETNELVAIKKTDRSKEVYRRFKGHDMENKIVVMMTQEADIMREFDHPNLLRLYDFLIIKLDIYLVIQFAEGGELFNKILKRGKFGEKDSRRIIKQIISGVKYMHNKGYVHRDIKAENILFADKTPGSRVLIADFGLSKKSQDTLHTNCGTVSYSAPELLMNKTTKEGYNYKVDNWSIGVLTYFILSGMLPFNSPNQNENEIKRQILSGKYTYKRPPWAKISAQAKQFITSLLAQEPNSRLELEDAYNHTWITQIEVPPIQFIDIYPIMEVTLKSTLALVRWKTIIYFNISVTLLATQNFKKKILQKREIEKRSSSLHLVINE